MEVDTRPKIVDENKESESLIFLLGFRYNEVIQRANNMLLLLRMHVEMLGA